MLHRFRPLIGVNFCKPFKNVNRKLSEHMVFVPLSGLTSVNGLLIMRTEIHYCFRPLIGVNFCKPKYESGYVEVHSVFVPLSGLTSVNKVEALIPMQDTVFVPLSGLTSVNLFLKLIQRQKFKNIKFSSPYRG